MILTPIDHEIALLERKIVILKQIRALDGEIAALRGCDDAPTRAPMVEKAGLQVPPKAKPIRRFKPPQGKPPLTDFLRQMVRNKPASVTWLAAMVKRAGYRTGNIAQVIRLMVAKAKDLTRTADDKVKRRG